MTVLTLDYRKRIIDSPPLPLPWLLAIPPTGPRWAPGGLGTLNTFEKKILNPTSKLNPRQATVTLLATILTAKSCYLPRF